MSILIYNSLTRKKDPFEPQDSSLVKMYVCGPTVYDEPHIGHARSAYIFDIAKRYLEYKGYRVKFVRNVTDVDDKIIERARKEFPGEELNSACKKVAEKYLLAFHKALEDLEIELASNIIEPKASEYIDKMVVFISDLIEKKKAYASGGDVYFDITQAGDYGKLSQQSVEKMEAGARVLPSENKKNHLDFALWKRAKENEPSWDSPWGEGRPGWHIECSTMSSYLLGDSFDIHGGGIDLIFPHHENEIAQSEGSGKKFARFWMHHGLLTINGQKMAKSLGNFITVKNILDKYPADVLKIFYLQAHYSHPLDFTWEKMQEAKNSYERIGILKEKLEKINSGTKKEDETTGNFRGEFLRHMDDDFNAHRALATLFEFINYCNVLLEKDVKENIPGLVAARSILKSMTDILGLTFSMPGTTGFSDEEIIKLIKNRQESKRGKDFKEADRIRRELDTKGIVLEDTKGGETTWRRKI